MVFCISACCCCQIQWWQLVPIAPVTTSVHAGNSIKERQQPPLKLAWALTIHESQGLILHILKYCLINFFIAWDWCQHVKMILSHKLRCYTGISRPKKNRNNTREKFVFFHVCWYSQSAADTSLSFGTTRSGWWMNGKAFTIPNTSCLSELSQVMAAKTLKNSYRWQTVRFKLF